MTALNTSDLVIFVPGTRWQDTQGTDHRLAEAMTAKCCVLWVDPPLPVVGPAAAVRPRSLRRIYLDQPVKGLHRLRYLVPPKFTRAYMEPVVKYLRRWAVASALKNLKASVQGTVLLSPRDDFLPGVPGFTALHVTDDWIAGAQMMGLDTVRVTERLRRNIALASSVTAVSPHLAEQVSTFAGGRSISILPNGCTPVEELPPACGGPRAVLLGQLNERLDFDLLDSLVDDGIRLEIIGPRREHEASCTLRLDHLLNQPSVKWWGELPARKVPAILAGASVGLTPYVQNEFNRSSFPLKTLDYLAAGLPVVATDSPAVRWLASPDVHIASDSQAFRKLVRKIGAAAPSTEERERLRNQAMAHSWEARADQLLITLGRAA